MSDQVFYRKWRPQRFSDVVGQAHVTTTLLNALASGRVAHAYLFCGPRGTGKTSTGRILAKAVNCLKGGQGEPCNQCSMCQAITEGRAMDLIEIDAASNRGIDEIRSLREKVNFAPNEARSKVYIIDEVHMLTTPAFNALLKTLEEPPPQTIFVLATTEAHKLPATVISRCQRFDLRRISRNGVVERLARICESEGAEATDGALGLIARISGGSLRDAENLLEQLVVGREGCLDEARVRQVLGVGGDEQARALALAAAAGDVKGGLAAIAEASDEGVDLAHLHREAMVYLRSLMLVKAGAPQSADAVEASQAFPMEVVEGLSMEAVLRALRAFGQADMKTAPHSPLPLELALIDSAAPPAAAAQAPARSVPAPAKPASPPPPRPAPPRPVEELPERRPSPPARQPTPPPPAPAAASPPEPALVNGGVAGTPDEKFTLLRDNWRTVVEASRGKGQKYKLDALLRGGRLVSMEGNAVVVGFTHQKFVDMMKEEIENPGSRVALEEAVGAVLGERYQVRCVVRPAESRPKGGHLMRAAEQMGGKVVEGRSNQT